MGIFKSMILIAMCAVLSRQGDPMRIKRFSDSNFRYEFYVTDKNVVPKTDKIYYWFKGGAVHHSQSGFGGHLLDGKFTKAFHSNNIAEQGEFKTGLKIGSWKTWHSNGILETEQFWRSGLKQGSYNRFNSSGELMESGYFKNGKKKGRWIDFVTGDTIIYKKGMPLVEKIKLSREERKKQRIEEKDKKRLAAQLKKENNKKEKAQNKEMKKVKREKTVDKAKVKSDGNLFQRLVKKKQKDND